MLSKAQSRVLNEIEKYISANRISPTVRELKDLLEFKSTSTVQEHLNRLEKKGYISKHPTSCRTITVVKETNDIVPVQMVKLTMLKEQLEALKYKQEYQDDVKESLNLAVMSLANIIEAK